MKTEIDRFNPCRAGLDFRKKFNTFEEAWNACERGDWMLWIAARLEADIRILTLAKGLCANTVRHLMKDKRSTAAVDAAIAFGNGEIDENDLKIAASAAFSVPAYFAADASASAYASVVGGDSAAYASATASYAAYASAADTAAAYFVAKTHNRKLTADICREVLTSEVLRLISEPRTKNQG